MRVILTVEISSPRMLQDGDLKNEASSSTHGEDISFKPGLTGHLKRI